MRTLYVSLFFVYCLQADAQKFQGLALTPPMGWNSWNRFACDSVNETVIRSMADAMVSSGMKDAGYQYVVIDDCWQISRDSMGNILADPQKFPSGIKSLADYIHARGLKFGIYTCAGTKTCAGRPASRGYEFQDARQYARWGIDFLKEDWCNTAGQDPKESYQLMRDALYKAGRPILFSICEWGMSKPWLWASDVGHSWRTTGDISNNWAQFYSEQGKVWGGGVLTNLKMQHGLEKYAGPGHWNDPDMLELGNGVLTPEEERAHFSLWCMLAAPLMAGNDLAKMSPLTRAILTEKEVIAIDQDPLGRQATEIMDDPEWMAYVKPLAGGDTAICFLNKSGEEKELQFDWAQHGFSVDLAMRDVWAHRNLGPANHVLKRKIARHDVLLLRLHGSVPETTLPPPSGDFEVSVDGRKIFVHDSPIPAAYCSFELNHPVTVRIRANRDVKWVDVRPASANVHPVFKDSLITMQLDKPMQLSVELNGSLHHPLFVFANPRETGKPNPADPHVHFFGVWGNGLEIGFELNSQTVENLVFRNSDLIHVQDGAAFSIHNAGRSRVKNVLFDDIRVEDANQKLFDLAIFRSRYSDDSARTALENKRLYLNGAWDGVLAVPSAEKAEHAQYRGRIDGIVFRNIQVVGGPQPFSLFIGYDEAHKVENVTIENLTVHGNKILSLAAAKCYLENTNNITIR